MLIYDSKTAGIPPLRPPRAIFSLLRAVYADAPKGWWPGRLDIRLVPSAMTLLLLSAPRPVPYFATRDWARLRIQLGWNAAPTCWSLFLASNWSRNI